HHRVHEDRAVDADDVLAIAHHRLPPRVLDVALELDAERTVIPGAVEPAVELRRLKEKAAPARERDQLVHQLFRGDGHEATQHSPPPPPVNQSWTAARVAVCSHASDSRREISGDFAAARQARLVLYGGACDHSLLLS